jgi:hypothetical protein
MLNVPTMLTFMFHVKQILGRSDKTVVFHVELLGAHFLFSGATSNSRSLNVSRGTTAPFDFDALDRP